MLTSQIGLEFPPTLGGIPERREEASLESAHRMRLRKKIPVQLLWIDLSEISGGQSHKPILPSSSPRVSSRMANVRAEPRRLTIGLAPTVPARG